ncbi:MAG: sulfotransferase [Chloroflexi bacterium]|nr:sulfotransferase [Chloroflexota bacterium]
MADDGAHEAVIVVSGLPRSGTSLMMRMLAAGGVDVVTDGLRQADADNPAGYYEFERVKKLTEGDTAWLEACRGRAVKVISALLGHLPGGYAYRVIFMQRDMAEVLASQQAMLARRGQPGSTDDLATIYGKHAAQVTAWMGAQANFQALMVDYNRLLSKPEGEIARVNRFLGGRLDEAKMAAAIEPGLYRQRRIVEGRQG